MQSHTYTSLDFVRGYFYVKVRKICYPCKNLPNSVKKLLSKQANDSIIQRYKRGDAYNSRIQLIKFPFSSSANFTRSASLHFECFLSFFDSLHCCCFRSPPKSWGARNFRNFLGRKLKLDFFGGWVNKNWYLAIVNAINPRLNLIKLGLKASRKYGKNSTPKEKLTIVYWELGRGNKIYEYEL